MKTIGRILLGIILGAAVGGGGMWLYIQYEQRQGRILSEEQTFRKRRKAHRDSLLQIRNNQEQQERKNRESEARRRAVAAFIDDFYREAVLGSTSMEAYERNLTPHCRQRLTTDNSSGGENQTVMWALFCADVEETGTGRDELRRNLRITPEEDDWYRVRLAKYGVTEFRHVKAIVQGRDVMIDDVR